MEVWGGGGEICTFSCSPKAAVPCCNRISWPTVSEFSTFYFPFEGNVKMHQRLFEIVACESLCIPFDENKMANVEEPFLASFGYST